MYVLRAHINHSFLKTFYEKLIKNLSLFHFLIKAFLKWFINVCSKGTLSKTL